VKRGVLEAELAAHLDGPMDACWIVDDAITSVGGRGGDELSEAVVAAARACLRRCASGMPLQYALGHWSFRSLDLQVDDRVLIPRPETEGVVEAALIRLDALNLEGRDSPPVVVDLGTGSGAIALSVAVEGRIAGVQLWAVDVDERALEVAAANYERVAQRFPDLAAVTFVPGSWWGGLPGDLQGNVDLAIANPPYVSESEFSDLDPTVRREPHGALVAGAGSDGTPGFADIEQILLGSVTWLGPDGTAFVELAPHQAHCALSLARSLGFAQARVLDDLAGRQRTLVVQR
jgi:release factor glutamine methyltransferase